MIETASFLCLLRWKLFKSRKKHVRLETSLMVNQSSDTETMSQLICHLIKRPGLLIYYCHTPQVPLYMF